MLLASPPSARAAVLPWCCLAAARAAAAAAAVHGWPRLQCGSGARRGGSHAARFCSRDGVVRAGDMSDDRSAAGPGVCREEASTSTAPTSATGEPTVCACGRPTDRISVTVKPTTGGQFAVTAASDDSVDYLKLLVSQKLKVPKERICLLYRNR